MGLHRLETPFIKEHELVCSLMNLVSIDVLVVSAHQWMEMGSFTKPLIPGIGVKEGRWNWKTKNQSQLSITFLN